MEVGQQNKIAFVIQARMKSTRLPGKILLPIPIANGKPLLLWIVEQLRRTVSVADLWVATSSNEENDILEQFCKEHHLSCFRGDEEDVLSRFVAITRQGDYDTVVRLTADNPVLDVELLDKCVQYHIDQKNDYTLTSTLPLGMNFEVVSGTALLSTLKAELKQSDREHVTLFIKNNSQYKKGEYLPGAPSHLNKLRLTVDYPSDLLVVSTVLSFMKQGINLQGIALVEHVWRTYPFVFEVNQANFQKKQFKSPLEEMKFAKELLTKLELMYSVSILKKNEENNTL